jgi:hypothetical protein
MIPEFKDFPKMARLSRPMIITEKIDGTNASIFIGEDGTFLCGSRSRWLSLEDDHYNFAKWAHENKEDLMKLGPGHHFGEWWGSGIQKSYGLVNGEKRFSLFNVSRWTDPEARPKCCHVVPILYTGPFDTTKIDEVLRDLAHNGSVASPGFKKPEGIIIWHTAANIGFKKTVHKDEVPKSLQTDDHGNL